MYNRPYRVRAMCLQPALTRSALVLLLGLTFGSIAASPQSAAQEPPSSRVLIRRGPEPRAEPQGPLLTFNIVVHDAKGEPFPDLRNIDLDIRDDGKKMRAVFCRPVETAGRQGEPLGPYEYTNRNVEGNSQSVLILLDLLNADLAERGLGWQGIVTALKEVESGAHLYFYLLTKAGTLYPIHPLPYAGSSEPPGGEVWAARIQTLLDEAMHKVDGLRLWEFQVDPDARVRKTIHVLRDLASDFAAQPGRKTLVWISHGIPIQATGGDGQWHDYTVPVMRLGTDLASSGITVFAVDQSERSTSGLNSADTLEQIAGLTGGQWFPTDFVEQAVHQVGQGAREGRATYEVGYVPPMDRWNNKFHKVRVTAEGQGGIRLRVRAIEGYYGDARKADPAERFVLAALGQADDSGIGIRALATPSGRVKGWMHFEIRVNAADLHLGAGPTYTGEIRLAFAHYTTAWQPDISEEIPIQLRLTGGERDQVVRDGVDLSYDRPVPAGASKVRLVVRETQTGAVGSLTIPVSASGEQ